MMSECCSLKKAANLLKKYRKIRYILNELEARTSFDMGTWPSDLALSKAETITDSSSRPEKLKIQV